MHNILLGLMGISTLKHFQEILETHGEMGKKPLKSGKKIIHEFEKKT